MSNQKTRLELTWIGKNERPKLEPRILLEDLSKSYSSPHKLGDNDIFDNMDHYPNLTVKKIPQHILSRCEWGHDDYSLHVENLPSTQLEQNQQSKSNEEIVFNEPTC